MLNQRHGTADNRFVRTLKRRMSHTPLLEHEFLSGTYIRV